MLHELGNVHLGDLALEEQSATILTGVFFHFSAADVHDSHTILGAASVACPMVH